MNNLFEIFFGIFWTLWQGIETILSPIITAIGWFIENAIPILTGLIQSIIDGFGAFWTWITGLFGG